jgi:NADH-quinone oxidoreductase subunit L
MTEANVFHILGIVVVVAPAILLAAMGIPPLVGRPLSERIIARWTVGSVVTGLLAAIVILIMMLLSGTRHVSVELGEWVVIPEHHFHFTLKFVFDRLSVPFVILSFLLCGTIGAFANSYMHREAGFARFFLSFALFLLGMIICSPGGNSWAYPRPCWWRFFMNVRNRCEMDCEYGWCIALQMPRS